MKINNDVPAAASANTGGPLAASRLRAGGSGWHRVALLLSFLPLVVFLIFGLAMRVSSPLSGPSSANRAAAFASAPISAEQAWQSAERITSAFTGQRAYLRATDQMRSYSPLTRSAARYWEIICESGGKWFIFRINADTGKVVSVNARSRRRGGSASSIGDDSPASLSEAEAEERAKTYLRALVVDSFTPFLAHGQVRFSVERKRANHNAWTFPFLIEEGAKQRTAVVVVDAKTGAFMSARASIRRNPARVDAPGV